MTEFSADIMERIDQTNLISESGKYLLRRSYTPEHRQVNDLAAGWMRDAGMKVHEDAVGNVIGRYEGRVPGAPAIVIGSHLDTVVNAGRYDGTLGVLSAIDCVRSLSSRGIRLENAVEVVSFVDEEGVRFQSAFFGSKGMAGSFDLELLDHKDADGISLADAMSSFGLDPARIGDAARTPEEIRCFMEVHIEQGPVLENEGLSLGVVTAISGAVRMKVTLTGVAGHAGTVPMNARQDALVAASECILLAEKIAGRYQDAVATIGEISVESGATNVIPGKVVFSVDIRAADDAVRRTVVDEFLAGINTIAAHRGVFVDTNTSMNDDGVACAPWIIKEMEDALEDTGCRAFRLPSGAGHDAVPMAGITDVGMIFVRCKGGISHNPAEEITRCDAIAGARLLLRTVERIGGLES